MVKKFFQRCRGVLCAPFVRWWGKRALSPPQNVAAASYEALSGQPAMDKGSAMQRRLRGTVLDTLTARVGPGHLAAVPLLMTMAYDEPSPLRRRVYERRALNLARSHYGYSHPLTLFIEDQQDQLAVGKVKNSKSIRPEPFDAVCGVAQHRLVEGRAGN